MGKERGPESPVTEQYYEIPPYQTMVETVMKHAQRQSIQDCLDALANDGYYLVRRRKELS